MKRKVGNSMDENRKVFSIRSVMTIVFLIIMLLSILSITTVLFSRWHSSAELSMRKITSSINQKIYQNIETFMEIPLQVNQSNEKLISGGILNIENEIMRERFFVGTLTTLDEQIYSFSYGTEDGEYYGARRNPDGVIEIMRNNESTKGESWYYSVNDDYSAGALSGRFGKFDPRTRAWYKAAVSAEGASFSPLYRHFVMDDLAVSAARPIYDDTGSLKGVLGTHMLLSDIGSYLKDAVNPYDGYSLIIEKQTGYLVANSMDYDNFLVLQNGSLKRNYINDLKDDEINAIYSQYLSHSDSEDFMVTHDGRRVYVNVHEIDIEGLNWLVFSVIPERFLMSEMFESINLTIVLMVLMLVISVVIIYLVARKLFLPIDNLVQVADSIASGDLSRRVEVKRGDEIGYISKTVNSIADNLQYLIQNLETSVEDRTHRLNQANKDLDESRNRLQLLLDSTAEGIYGIDLDGRCTFCNVSALKMLGFASQAELLGKDVHKLFHHSYADGTPFPQKECRIYQSVRTGEGYNSEDEVFWKTDGTSFAVSYHSYPQVRDGVLVGGVITFNDITSKKDQESQIEYLRCHDYLTGLHNRGCMEESLPSIDIEENYPLSIIFGDLNGLKLTNDIFGHPAGDKLIRKAAQILKDSSRPEDRIARIGGDEFLLLLPKTDEKQAEQIIETIRRGFSTAKVEAVKCSISLGYATRRDSDEKIQELFARAENDMYIDKAKRRKQVDQAIILNVQNSLHSMSLREKQHSVFVRDTSLNFGRYLKLSETDLSILTRSAYFHDIGKITLGKELLDKDPLTEEEFLLMTQHPVIGFRILELFDDTLDLADLVYSHHERWDGTGYPRGLKGEQIPFIARILSIVESFDRILSRMEGTEKERYRKASQEIKAFSGIQFDPDLVKKFISFLAEQDLT
ncbi:MAG: diguanylate cyclase [Sphaerochaetaceae bacterium]|nr:diguanylate cyclase [Sphaerochaetaceae bacterium]